jgi:hypothetical protein
MSMAGRLYGFGPAIWTGELGWDMLYGRELYGLWLELNAFFALGFYFVLSLFVGDGVLLTQSIRYRLDKAMHRKEWIM